MKKIFLMSLMIFAACAAAEPARAQSLPLGMTPQQAADLLQSYNPRTRHNYSDHFGLVYSNYPYERAERVSHREMRRDRNPFRYKTRTQRIRWLKKKTI